MVVRWSCASKWSSTALAQPARHQVGGVFATQVFVQVAQKPHDPEAALVHELWARNARLLVWLARAPQHVAHGENLGRVRVGALADGLFLRLDYVAILGVVADVLVQRPVLVVVAEIGPGGHSNAGTGGLRARSARAARLRSICGVMHRA